MVQAFVMLEFLVSESLVSELVKEDLQF